MLDIPSSSLRRYASIFAQYLEPNARRRKRLYSDQDILTLRRVRDLAGQGLTTDQIAQRLEVVDVDQPTNALALMPGVIQEFENVRSTIAQQAERISALEAQIAELQARLDRPPRWQFWKK